MLSSSLTTDEQLSKMAKKLKIPLNAVVSKDLLYGLKPEAGGYIINMEDSDAGGGSHWVAMWFNPYTKKPSIPLYFDSFGVDPPISVMDFMKKWNDICLFSTKKIQNINSGYCGQYCIYFIHQMALNGGDLTKRYQNFTDFFKF